MKRDEHGKFVKATAVSADNYTEKAAATCYHSKVLNKYFEDYDSMIAEEKAFFDKKREDDARVAKRKAEAAVVEEAFKKMNDAKRAYNEKVTELKKTYSKAIATAKKEFADAAYEETEKVKAAEDKYAQTLDEFRKNHPEGYHMTFRDGDFVTTISEASFQSILDDFYSSMLKLF